MSVSAAASRPASVSHDRRSPVHVARCSNVIEAFAMMAEEMRERAELETWAVALVEADRLVAASDPAPPPYPGSTVIDVRFGDPAAELRLVAVDSDPSVSVTLDLASTEAVTRSLRRIGRVLEHLIDAEERVIAERRRADRAEALRTTDDLTGVGDHGAWWRHVARIEAHDDGEPVTIAVVDLDDLKQVNDQQGHLAGDELLRVAARSIEEAVRDTDVVARIGGDEFAVMAVGHDGDADALRQRLEQHLIEAGVAASVGAAPFTEGASLRETFEAADAAMYRVKRRRRVGRR